VKVVLERIRSYDPRATADLATGEVVEHSVDVSIDGRRRAFSVFLRANVLPNLDASMIHGDVLLEELLRFEPAALSKICSLVGQHRRKPGQVELPAVVLEPADDIVGLPPEAQRA